MKDEKWWCASMAKKMLEACGIDDVDGPDDVEDWVKNIYRIGRSDMKGEIEKKVKMLPTDYKSWVNLSDVIFTIEEIKP